MDNYNKQLEEFKKEMEKELGDKLENLPIKIKYKKEIDGFKRRLEIVLKRELKMKLPKDKRQHTKDCYCLVLR